MHDGDLLALTDLDRDEAKLAPDPSTAQRVSDAPDIQSLRSGRTRQRYSPTPDFLFTRFDPASLEDVIARASKASVDDPFRYIVTPNVDHVVRLARRTRALRHVYESAWMSVCDSKVIASLAKRSGLAMSASPGADLAAHLLDHVIEPGSRITVIGGATDTIAKLRARFEVAWHDPPMGLRHKPDAIAEAAAFIAAHPARFTFVCVGSPQQEYIARAALKRGDCVGVGLCVGASLAFYTDETPRAPLWMRARGLEWLHRLVSNPRRMWRRYLLEGPAILGLWLAWRRAHHKAAARIASTPALPRRIPAQDQTPGAVNETRPRMTAAE